MLPAVIVMGPAFPDNCWQISAPLRTDTLPVDVNEMLLALPVPLSRFAPNAEM